MVCTLCVCGIESEREGKEAKRGEEGRQGVEGGMRDGVDDIRDVDTRGNNTEDVTREP